MTSGPIVTPEAALLRVLVSGESDGPDLIRRVREWTDGTIRLDDAAFAAAITGLENGGLVERRTGSVDKRTAQPRTLFTLTTAGRKSALEVLAASLTRKV
jgi:DNA-binding PadR family transcriptional regulator